MRSGAGSKQKGADFERRVCKDLSLWVTHNKRDDCLWRSAMSGGRATVAKKKDVDLQHVSGDICAVHPDGYPLVAKFFIECKFYKDLRYAQLVSALGGSVVEFWKIACAQAADHKKWPMVILKQNQYPALIGITDAAACWLKIQRAAQVRVGKLDLSLYAYEPFLRHTVFPRNNRRVVE